MFFKKSKEEERLLHIDMLSKSITLDVQDRGLRTQIEMIDLTKQDLQITKALKPFVVQNIEVIVDSFYKTLANEPSLMGIINNHSHVDRLKKTLNRHIQEMFDGVIDDNFVQARHKIAFIHMKIGLQPKWYLCAFQALLNSLIEILAENLKNPRDFHDALGPVTKILNLEQQIVLEAYENELEKERQKSADEKEVIRKHVNETALSLAAIAEETSASVEEVNAQARVITDIANSSFQVASSAETETYSGRTKIIEQKDMMQSIEGRSLEITEQMLQLQEVSKEIGNIVTIVTNIAEQTNLLALNAAIEAARAGESGKGFAVVASEVRKLAEETKKSVSSVTTLIDKTIEQIEDISDSVKEVAQLTKDGRANIEELNDFFNSILETMAQNKNQSETTTGEIDSISRAIDDISQAVDNIAQSADELGELSSKI